MKIRKLTNNDYSELLAFWQETGIRIDSLETEEKKVLGLFKYNPSLQFALMDSEGKIVGSILGGFDGRRVTVYKFAIHPKYQKQGNGTMLLDEFEKRVREIGINTIFLDVLITNIEVMDFYKKRGYIEDKVIRMKKKLE